MMTLTIPGQQRWNEKTEEFVYTPAVVLKLEHSLLSLAHWESNWNIPFLSNLDKLTVEQWLDYIRCMTVTKGVDPEVYARLTREQYRSINEYMEAPGLTVLLTLLVVVSLKMSHVCLRMI